jgi:Tfp pilus assembly protein PilF
MLITLLAAGGLGLRGQQQSGDSKAHDDAVAKAQAAVASASDAKEKSTALVALGRAYFDQGEEKQAETQFQQALQLDQSNASAHLELGRLGLASRNLDKAEAEFKEVIRLVPDAGAGYAALGETLAQKGRAAEARPLLQKAVDLDAQDWYSRYRLATILTSTADAPRAHELLEEVKQLNPGFMPAREQLALDRFRHGDTAGATAQAQAMLEKDSKAPEGHRILALAFWKERQYEASLAECALALQGDPHSTAVLALQAVDLWQLGRKKESHQVLGEVAREPAMVAAFTNVDAFCRLLICDHHDIGIVDDFLRRNRWALTPEP